MTEVKVVQLSAAWFKLRQSLAVTASRFGDVLGLGRGRPYDFFVSLVVDDPIYENLQKSETMQLQCMHGVKCEPVINEAYQLLTGYETHKSGFWLPDRDNILYGVSGASPDGLIYKKDKLMGLSEYKAPVYRMYTKCPHGIPRQHMAQIQGQMAICNQPWCDFMAVCTASEEITLQRVYFQPLYWKTIATEIKLFCNVVQEARARKLKGQDPLQFEQADFLKDKSLFPELYPGEQSIQVTKLITKDCYGRFRSRRGAFSYDFLMAEA